MKKKQRRQADSRHHNNVVAFQMDEEQKNLLKYVTYALAGIVSVGTLYTFAKANLAPRYNKMSDIPLKELINELARRNL